MKKIVLVRGGGDIATGCIYRLRRAGFPVVVTEIKIPTMVRTEVAYGNAVHKGEMTVERYTARYMSLEEALLVLSAQQEGRQLATIPVVTEDYEKVLDIVQPTIVVDAILAKHNLGTDTDDAPLVIACGPGFTAGRDVDVVVETMRGHTLGRCIYDGPALPNTGVPGNVGGYTKERVLYAPEAGLFTAKRYIGEHVETGEIIGFVDDKPVKSQIKGVLRGVLTSGLLVTKGMKLGDVDARCKDSHCFTISDKALAVGGGVVEAALAFIGESITGDYV